MILVLKIGGSVLIPDLKIDANIFERWASVIWELMRKYPNLKLVVVVGGGRIAREYIRALATYNSFEKDHLGILITRANAHLLMLKLKERGLNVCPRISETPYDVVNNMMLFDVVVTGGYLPGNSTAGVAAITAEAINADMLVVATNVKGVYDSDPRTHKDARKLDIVNIEDLLKMFYDQKMDAGTYFLLDILAIKILKRAKIPAIIFDGKDPEIFLMIIDAILQGKLETVKQLGSLILPTGLDISQVLEKIKQ